jgi:hypothetical protein
VSDGRATYHGPHPAPPESYQCNRCERRVEATDPQVHPALSAYVAGVPGYRICRNCLAAVREFSLTNPFGLAAEPSLSE